LKASNLNLKVVHGDTFYSAKPYSIFNQPTSIFTNINPSVLSIHITFKQYQKTSIFLIKSLNNTELKYLPLLFHFNTLTEDNLFFINDILFFDSINKIKKFLFLNEYVLFDNIFFFKTHLFYKKYFKNKKIKRFRQKITSSQTLK
jgi:hypothetical protein